MLISRMLSATMIAGAPDAARSPSGAAQAPCAPVQRGTSRLGPIFRRGRRARAGRHSAQASAGARAGRSAAAHNH